MTEDRRFFNMFPGLTEEKAIEILATPLEQLDDSSERYIAASHLINFPTERSINALITTVQDLDPAMDHRIARRKAVESLGRLKAQTALPTIRSCLTDPDQYTVENAVWAIGEIGTDDDQIKAEITNLLQQENQSYRVIIQTLANFDYKPAIAAIEPLTTAEDKLTASTAITAICRLTNDYSGMNQIVEFLQHEQVKIRRAAMQDLADAQYYEAIAAIAKCPISLAFRVRALRLLAQAGLPTQKIAFSDIEPYLDDVILDHPKTLDLLHEYDQLPSLDFVINELYQTDFGRCYLATQTMIEHYAGVAGPALMLTYEKSAHNDYGAHYHVIKLWGWLKYEPARELIIRALHNTEPQFQKSRGAAAIALAQLGGSEVVSLLKEQLNSSVFGLKYACLLALNQLGYQEFESSCFEGQEPLLQQKLERLSSSSKKN
ncbi:MAG: HEAT repeat domain-containing protein [Spirulina sp. SIO3F2]|nr:HEAT repeat domain-containing protein [Spirulina sp. SIO3F2]